MKKTKSLILIGFLLVFFIGELFAQSTVPFVNQITSANTGTKIFQARSLITFGPGFSYIPSGGTLTTQIVDPLIDGTIEYSQSQTNLSGRNIDTNYKPGTLPGIVDITQVGSAGYTIPIELPKGVGGFQPSLAVTYSSMAGDGIMGESWSFDGLGVITRVPSSMYFDNYVDGVNLDLNDRFAIDGRILICSTGTYGEDGSEYRLETDQSIKISYSSGFFIVKLADGTIYKYGNTIDSRVIAQNNQTISWYLNSVTNRYNQSINVTYVNTNGYAYPVLMNYGESLIELFYKNRNSPHDFYIAGNTCRLENILDTIVIWNKGAIVRKYHFKYEITEVTNTVLLNEVVFFGMNGQRLNSTLFKYNIIPDYNSSRTVRNETNDYVNYRYRLVPGDFNRDGKTDLLCIPNPDRGVSDKLWKVMFGSGYRFTTPYPEYLRKLVNYDFNKIKQVDAVDLADDGLDDVVFSVESQNGGTKTTDFYYMINNRSGFFSPVKFHTTTQSIIGAFFNYIFSGTGIVKSNIKNIADYNGDGVNDILICDNTGSWKIFSFGHSNYNLQSINNIASGSFSTIPSKITTGDFNGDGKTDIWAYDDNGIKIFSLNNGSLVQKGNFNGFSLTDKFLTDDFNGDGMMDIFQYNRNIGLANRFLFSNGSSFTIFEHGQFQINEYAATGDLNGDGRADIISVDCGSSNISTDLIFVNRDGSLSCMHNIPNFPSNGYCLHLGDYDGDGQTDFLTTDNTSPFTDGFCYYSAPGYTQNLLSEISNGLGAYTKINYVQISHDNSSGIYGQGNASYHTYPLILLKSPLHIVNQVQTLTGAGGNTIIDYKYERALIHKGKGFLGFEKVIKENKNLNISIENRYLYESPYFHPKLSTSITKFMGDNEGNPSKVLNTVSNMWAVKAFTGSKRFIPYISLSTATDSLTGFVTTTNTSAPDNYGNILSQSVAYSNGPTHSRTIVYNNDATNWLVARPCSVTTVMSQQGSNTIQQLVTSTYDTGKAKPDIVKYFDGSSQKKQINYDYNDKGALSAIHELSTGLVEKHTYYYYDTIGINLLKKTYPDETRDTITYYAASGLLNTVTDYLGNTKTYSYDNFGNVSSMSQTNGIGITSNTLAWVTSPTNARYSVTQNMADGSQTISVFDILGREIRSGVKQFNESVVYRQTDYNTKGQAYRVSEPFLSTSSPSQWDTTSFDPYGRVSGTIPAFGPSTTVTYSYGTTTVSSNGRTYTTVINSATGWPASKSDPGGTITYSYSPDGNVKQIKAPGNVITTMTYDIFGNQLTLNDPSAGSNSFAYHGGGELITQSTPLGTTTYAYMPDGRLNYYTNPAGTYDYSYGPNKLVSGITSPDTVSRSYTYYSSGKVDEISETIGTGQTMQTNKVKFVYDCLGRDSLKIFTNANQISYTESYFYRNGYLDQVKFNGILVYDVSTMNKRGQLTSASICGNTATWGYNTSGKLISQKATGVMQYSYVPYPNSDNLNTRTNSLKSLTETFYYDNLDRLTSITGTNALTLTYDTDGKGNITSKSDAGTLVYDNGKPYQVAHVTPYTSNFPAGTQTVTYTSFGKVKTLTDGNYSATFKYNSDNERVKMVIRQSGTVIKTKYYFGSSYEKVIEGSTTMEYIWIGGSPYTAVAVARIVNGGTPQVYAIFRDNLGTITHLKSGSEILEYSFDAFGRRRDKDTWSYTLTGEPVLFADRGFTGHEHLTQFGLINMNGRLYDPLVGRFLSPDNYVQSPGSTQGYNRYSYCLNNPLRYTDPSGDNPALVSAGIFAAFVYLKGAYDNRDMETGKWAWNPASWFGKGKTGVVVGVNTNTDFTSMNYYAGLYSPDFSPVLSYSPNYGLGVGDVTTPGSSSFYYPSYNPPSAESVANRVILKANVPQGGGVNDGMDYVNASVGAAGSYFGLTGNMFHNELYWVQKNGTLRSTQILNNSNKIYRTSYNVVKESFASAKVWSNRMATLGLVTTGIDIAVDGQIRPSHMVNLSMTGISYTGVGSLVAGGYWITDMGFEVFTGNSLGDRLDQWLVPQHGACGSW